MPLKYHNDTCGTLEQPEYSYVLHHMTKEGVLIATDLAYDTLSRADNLKNFAFS